MQSRGGVNIDSIASNAAVVPVLRDGDQVIVGVTERSSYVSRKVCDGVGAPGPEVMNNPVVMVGKCGRVGPKISLQSDWRYRSYRATGLLIPF